MRMLPLTAGSLLFPVLLSAQGARRIPFESGRGLEPINVELTPVTWKGRKALRVVQGPTAVQGIGESIAVIPWVDFREGTIELEVAGAPGPRAQPDDRGFIGLAFHISPARDRFKTFYLRPTNGRADDQLRRNHATQFTAEPDWPWERLRKEQPGQYESYVDLVAGEWTRIRIVVSGGRAELYVNGATQPTLVVTDLKDGVTGGGIALWIGRSTEGHFADLRVTDGTSRGRSAPPSR